jgi:TPR repeat protein
LVGATTENVWKAGVCLSTLCSKILQSRSDQLALASLNLLANLGQSIFMGRAAGDTNMESMPLDELCQAAEHGDPRAQSELGWRHHQGNGVAKDCRTALHWYQRSAEQGDASAQNRIGLCHEKGEGVERDYDQAFRWYQKAAAQGNAKAQNNLGLCYGLGRGVPQDHAAAAKWFRLSAEQGFDWGEFHLARAYGEGLGLPRNETEALKWCRSSKRKSSSTNQPGPLLSTWPGSPN